MALASAPQLELMAFLSDLGLTVVEEHEVGQFFVDIWCEEGWLGFEYDGEPYHRTDAQRRRDRERAQWLWDNAGIPLLRVTPEMLRDREALAARVVDYCEEHADSYQERRQRGLWSL